VAKKLYSDDFKINIQLFADPDKTEDPTARKLAKAREEGNIPQSKEFIQAMGFLGISALLYVFITPIFSDVINLFYDYFDLDIRNIDENALLFVFFQHSALYLKLAALFIGGMVLTLILSMLQTKFLIAPKAMKLNLGKLNPIKGFKKIFSFKSVVELIKSLIKIAVVGYLSYSIIVNNLNDIIELSTMEVMFSFQFVGNIALEIMFKLGIALLIISIGDIFYQKYEYKKELKMTKKEVKDERKDIEGNPEVKRKQRQIMQQFVFSRMIQEVPTADVVVTNPTHYAVAIKYDTQKMSAPKIVAKGADEIAEKIKQVARENNVPIIEKPVLARMLYNNLEIDEYVSEEFYKPVAELLAYVYNLKDKKK
jgi:flagellar biosynthetic protein FlhB